MAVGLQIFPVAAAPGTHYRDDWGEPRSGGRTHQGNDLFGPEGTPLLAVEDGTIAKAYVDPLGGNAVTLRGASGTSYYYAHLSSFAVKAGDRVRAGDKVGTLGKTGNAQGTPPHLHFEVHPGGGPAVDPYAYLRASRVVAYVAWTGAVVLAALVGALVWLTRKKGSGWAL
jgi:murein DD-endopeptidase MepM/ murein hydrolase activator NlpD